MTDTTPASEAPERVWLQNVREDIGAGVVAFNGIGVGYVRADLLDAERAARLKAEAERDALIGAACRAETRWQEEREAAEERARAAAGVVPTGAPLDRFAAWFRQNYPGPDTIISKPDWHSPKIFRAALAALRPTPAGDAPPQDPAP